MTTPRPRDRFFEECALFESKSRIQSRCPTFNIHSDQMDHAESGKLAAVIWNRTGPSRGFINGISMRLARLNTEPASAVNSVLE